MSSSQSILRIGSAFKLTHYRFEGSLSFLK